MVFGVPDFDSGKALPYKDSMFQPAEVRETGEIVRPLVTLEVTPEGKKLIWLVTDTKERVKGVLGDVAEFQKNIQRLRPDDGTRLSEQPIGTIAVSPMLKNAGFPWENIFFLRSVDGRNSILLFDQNGKIRFDLYKAMEGVLGKKRQVPSQDWYFKKRDDGTFVFIISEPSPEFPEGNSLKEDDPLFIEKIVENFLELQSLFQKFN